MSEQTNSNIRIQGILLQAAERIGILHTVLKDSDFNATGIMIFFKGVLGSSIKEVIQEYETFAKIQIVVESPKTESQKEGFSIMVE